MNTNHLLDGTFFALKIEAAHSLEMLVPIFPVYVPEDQNINVCCYENITYFVMILLCNVTMWWE